MRRRATCSVARPRCAAAWRRTTRCRRRSPWHAAPGRRRTCSPWRRRRLPRTPATRWIPQSGSSDRDGPASVSRWRWRAPATPSGSTAAARRLSRSPSSSPSAPLTSPRRPPGSARRASSFWRCATTRSRRWRTPWRVGEESGRGTGSSTPPAWQARRPLGEGTLENLLHEQPKDALTGPVARGDDATIRRHLASLTKDDALLYRALGRAALELAEKRGMDEATAARVADALATDLPLVLRPGAGT